MTFFTIISYIYDFHLAQLWILSSVDSNSKETAEVNAANSNTAQLIGIHLQSNRCGYIYFHSQGLKLTVGAGAVFTQQSTLRQCF